MTTNWDRLRSPLRLARALWSSRAWKLPPSKFEELFDRVYQATDELETLWQLGGALNDYLRFFPKALPIPPELPIRLLRSEGQDARVIGLKLLNRSGVPDDQLLPEIIRAIERDDDHESIGGFYELGQYCDRCHELGRKIPAAFAARLRPLLERCSVDVDDHPRWRAEYAKVTLDRMEMVGS